MQLVAYGAQDIYLTGNPQITFFKVVYRRHTNFSMESIQQTWDGVSTSDGRCVATISRNGDLVHRMYIELKCTGTSFAQSANSSSHGITDIELQIGGQKIDKQSGTWMEAWAELTEPNPDGFVAGNHTATTSGTLFQKMSGMGGVGRSGSVSNQTFFIPLQFWFCRNPGLALPLIALQYHEVKVIMNHILGNSYDSGSIDNLLAKQSLYCDYIYLDTDERRRFAQVSHEYLIEQVQEQTLSTPAGKSELFFNHPVKELVWCRKPDATNADVSGILSQIVTSGETTYKLKLNGHDRFAARDYRYFTRTQVWQHHTGPGGLQPPITGSAGDGATKFNDGIAVYSFALKPEEHQPSGTCNFSRIDSAMLIASGGNPVADHIFAVNYNVLRIMSGMGGLAYSN